MSSEESKSAQIEMAEYFHKIYSGSFVDANVELAKRHAGNHVKSRSIKRASKKSIPSWDDVKKDPVRFAAWRLFAERVVRDVSIRAYSSAIELINEGEIDGISAETKGTMIAVLSELVRATDDWDIELADVNDES